MKKERCYKCGKKTAENLKVETDIANYIFCPACIRDAYYSLLAEKDLAPAEVNLLQGFKKFLRKYKLLGES